MGEEKGSLRDRRRTETRRAIQAEAVRQFLERGYDATAVTDIAEAAGVSPMTVYRHFPTKEDLVLWDEYDRAIADRVAAQPAEGSLAGRIGRALIDATRIEVGSGDAPRSAAQTANQASLLARLRLMIATPALRARHWDSQFATQTAIVRALRRDPPDPELDFESWAVAGACQAAMNTALERWAQEDGRSDLPALIARALSAAFSEEF